MDLIRKIQVSFFKSEPKNPNEFVYKFVNDSKRKRAQLEMIYENEIILQVDSLRFVPSWFKLVENKESSYKNGYVIFFTKNIDIFESQIKSKYLKNKSKEKLLIIEEKLDNEDIMTLFKFVKEGVDSFELAVQMREIIDMFYIFKENNPRILFNIRYIDNVG